MFIFSILLRLFEEDIEITTKYFSGSGKISHSETIFCHYLFSIIVFVRIVKF